MEVCMTAETLRLKITWKTLLRFWGKMIKKKEKKEKENQVTELDINVTVE